ncbi:MAG TPA: hypothetical protein VI483_00305 [Candidatus Paceibacterota bacterium]
MKTSFFMRNLAIATAILLTAAGTASAQSRVDSDTYFFGTMPKGSGTDILSALLIFALSLLAAYMGATLTCKMKSGD